MPHTSHPAPRSRVLLCLGALVAGGGCFGELPTASDSATLPCFACPVTTDLQIEGITPLAVGDTLRLRAIAYQQNITFQGRFVPSRTAAWTLPLADSVRATLVAVRATADSATWGYTLLAARAPGTVTLQVQEDVIVTIRTLTILPATALTEALAPAEREEHDVVPWPPERSPGIMPHAGHAPRS